MIWLELDHLPTINSTILFAGAKPHGKGFSFTEPLNGSGDNSSARAKPTTYQGGWLKIQQDAEKAPRTTMLLLLRIHLSVLKSITGTETGCSGNTTLRERQLSRGNKLWFRCGWFIAISSGFATTPRVSANHLHIVIQVLCTFKEAK